MARLYYGLPGGYDAWKTTEPEDREENDYDPKEDAEEPEKL